MEEEAQLKSINEESVSDEDDDLEDDDDEEDYDDEDDADGFIASEDEVQKEIEKEEKEKRRQYRLEQKQKKREQVVEELDEEDFELIEENIGVPVQAAHKKRRLQRNVEREVEDEEMQQVHEPKISTQVRQEKAKKPSSKIDYQAEESDEDRELIDTSTIKKGKTHQGDVQESYYDMDRSGISRGIFEDPAKLAQRVKEAQRPKGFDEGNLDEMFDGDEIDDQFATKQDKVIASKDIPERLQLKVDNRLEDNFKGDIDEDIANETEWIYQRLIEQTSKNSLIHLEHAVKTKITTILKNFRKKNEYLDIPTIIKYRKQDYMKELTEQDVWDIFNLDLEYGKFQHQLGQMRAFLFKISQLAPSYQEFARDITKVRNMKDLQSYSALIGYLKSYYYEELQALPEEQKKKLPFKSDAISQFKKHRIDDLSRHLFLDPMHFVENLQHNAFVHRPPQIVVNLKDQIQGYVSVNYPETQNVLLAAEKFAAIELSVQPYIRQKAKEHFFHIAAVTTLPTEQGMKDLDPFHPSVRVKRVLRRVTDFNDDLFLDIIQCEKQGLITLKIEFDKVLLDNFQLDLLMRYTPDNSEDWRKSIYKETLAIMISNLQEEIQKEIKEQLIEKAENYVIQICQNKYRDLLKTGPFKCEDENNQQSDYQHGSKGRKNDDDIIPDRPRCTVMGVILQQIDINNSIVTLSIVDKYGDMITHKDLQHLMPPRQFKQNIDPNMSEEQNQRQKKAKQSHLEEVREHEADKDKIKELIMKYQVELIVVGANKLEARMIKKVLTEVAEGLKDFGAQRQVEETKKGNKKRQRDDSVEMTKEAFVIWGSLEVPKLFANSHQSQKLLKSLSPIVKQTVSLARFEQDPMNEILNLWSFTSSENQALHLNLHPMQKLLKQAKLADSLEQVSIQCVNEVGVDINLIVDHDHMHILLSFVSGFGPRKAKSLIQSIQKNQKITTRGELIQNHKYLDKKCNMSACAFLKIRLTPEERSNSHTAIELLDQTRIHPLNYILAGKIASDLVFDGTAQDASTKTQAIRNVIMNPGQLRQLDLEKYKQELETKETHNLIYLLEQVIEELKNPFRDPREYRTPTKQKIGNHELFYMLIDESERQFKRGIIVTATVRQVKDTKVICKLDNGLDAVIEKKDLENTQDALQVMVSVGHVIPGRVHEIKDKDEKFFGVTLNCKKKDLESHAAYVEDIDQFVEEDLKNYAFQTDKKSNQQGRFQSRRIAHPRFKNINSAKAIQELTAKETGEFMFRPSSKGTNNITLTWKFYSNNIVHIDIVEHDKAVGATIGAKLLLNDEFYENIQEIIERYIIPCNKHVKDAINNIKFKHCETIEELDNHLQEEKKADPQRIPYKMTILSQYPQHIVLGYIPKQQLVKEFIKVKPRGFYFHEKYLMPIQHLINWFKDNFRSKDYLKQLKRQRSPRAKITIPDQPSEAQNRDSKEWGGVSNEWRGQNRADSIRSANDDEGDRPFQRRNYEGDEGRGRGRGRGGSGSFTCHNCGESGHMVKDCPTKDQRKQFGRGQRNEGGGGGNGGPSYGRGQPRRFVDNQTRDNDDQPSSSPVYQANDQPAWGQSNLTAEPSVNWGGAQQSSQPAAETQGGWGNKTPSRGMDLGNDTNWGNNDNDDNNRGSPARSQRSQDDGGRGRGRGRGRGGSGPGNCFKCNESGHMARECPNPDTRPPRGRGGGDAGGSRACFKCGQEGHFSRECPNPDTRPPRGRGGGRGDGGPRTCYKCQQEGHMARECPNEGEGRPYKRRRDNDGGSVRRDDDNYNNPGANSSHGDNWGVNTNNGDGGWQSNNNNDWNNSSQNQTNDGARNWDQNS